MKRSFGILLVSAFVLSSCGSVRESRINPFNWFGSSETVETEAEEINPLIPRERQSLLSAPVTDYAGTLVSDVSSLRIERVAGGAVVRVAGVTATQGAFDVRLQPDNEDLLPEKGVLTFSLLALQPPGFRQGPARSREVTAAAFLTDQQLSAIRTIRVVGANKTLQSRR